MVLVHLVRVLLRFVLPVYVGVLLSGTGYTVYESLYGCNKHPCGLYQDAVRKSPNKARPHVNLAYALARRNELGKAMTEFQTAELLVLEMEPGDHRDEGEMLILMNESSILIRAGRFSDAREILKQSWLQYPHFAGFSINLASCYMQLQEPEKALFFLDDAEEHRRDFGWFSDDSALHVNREQVLAGLGRCQEATAEHQHVRRDPYTDHVPPFSCIERTN